MLAVGVWSVVGLGQMSAGKPRSGSFFWLGCRNFVVGSGIGGLFGSRLGIRSTLRKNAKKIRIQK
jgi:hypothetical protein